MPRAIDELQAVAAELEQYGKEQNSGLIKSLTNLLGNLSKGRGAPAPVAPDEQEDVDEEEPGDDEETAQAEEFADDGDKGDDGEIEEDDEEDEGNPEQPVRKSYSDDDDESLDEQLLKSLLLDGDGDPTPEADVIEVTPILSHMANTFAKSLGVLDARVRRANADRRADRELMAGIGLALVQIGTAVAGLQKSMSEVEKQPASTPFSGAMFGASKPRAGKGEQTFKPLNKSQAVDGVRAAFTVGLIDERKFQQVTGALDTQGVEVGLSYLPAEVVEQIRRNVK
jgi:hypothetical protein